MNNVHKKNIFSDSRVREYNGKFRVEQKEVGGVKEQRFDVCDYRTNLRKSDYQTVREKR